MTRIVPDTNIVVSGTATFLSACLFNSGVRGFGFAPRQLHRWAASRE